MQIPFAKFIQMLQYKAEPAGLQVILTEESYTSGTSFLDNECPTKEFYNKTRRHGLKICSGRTYDARRRILVE